MGNKILGKRSRSFYKGFNERQLSYLREKFQSLSEKGSIKKEIFIEAYKMNEAIFNAFLAEADFEEGGSVDEYEFICAVSYLCNLTVEEIGQKIFKMLITKANQKALKEADLEAFTSMCLLYNAYIAKTPPPDKNEIKKTNKKKFQKYDFDKSKSIQEAEFCKICVKDEDYKTWLYNMGFITKKQMDFQDQVYDLVDSDVGEEVDRHLNETNPNVDRVKRGAEHRMQGDDEFQLEETVGDQYTPIDKPWKSDTRHFTVRDFQAKVQENAPSQFLTLDYVLGYRSFDCRNNLKFDSKDRIVYHQAALGIVMTERLNRKENEPQFDQAYINEHKDDISCLDIAGNTVATGEVGSKPMIVLWDTNKKEDNLLHSSFVISKELANSVANLCISPSQKLLAATCNDEDHRLVIYNINQLRQLEKNLTSTKTGIICAGPLTKSLVFEIKFALDEKSIAAATVKELLFVTYDKGVINSSRGDFGNFSTTMALCLLPLRIELKKEKKDVMIAGMGNGSVYFWEKDKCIKAVVGHSGSVSSICPRTDVKSFISGDKTGKIIVWNDKFQKEQEINLKELNKNYPSLMVVALSQNSKRQLLIGTKSSHVYLMKIGDNIQKAKVVMSGHNEGTLWAMTFHKKQPYLYTGGEDQRLIKWDYVNTKKAIAEVKTPYKIRSLDYNDFSKLLLVGFFNGVIQCYNPDTLEKIDKLIYNKIKNPDEETLNLVKFQHYGKYFGVCYSLPTCKIGIMGVNDREIKPISFIDFKQKIISFDFTKSKENQEKFLRCNTSGGRYEIYNISKEKVEKVDNKNKKFLNITWDSHTLPYSPQLSGLYTTGVEEQDIVCCSRNDYYGNVILVGDKYSKIKLFNYPSIDNVIYNKYEGHSNAVTAIQFAPKEKYAVSLGGEEKSILIWKFDPVLTENEYLLEQERVDSDDEIVDEKVRSKKVAVNDDDDDQGKEATSAEKANATDHYKGQIKVPSKFVPNPKKDNQPPNQNLQIYHVFGIRNKYLKDQVRNHGRFSKNLDSILFPTACMGIKMNIETKEQIIYLEHKEDIVSFAVDKKRELMATGQMAEKNLVNPLKKILTICIWDIENKKLLQKLNGFHTIAIVLLEFSPSGKLLFTCGNDQKNTYAVYDWKAGTILYSGPISKGKVNGISWRNQLQFMTCGNDHVKLWVQSKSQMGSFPGNKSQGQTCCISSSDSIYLSGGSNGNIYSWSGNSGSAPIKAHEGKVQCLFKKQYFIYSGGDDGLIKKWRRQNNGSIKNCELFIDSRAAFANRKEIPLTEEQYGILSIDFASQQSQELLFLTKGCSAVYCNKNKYKVITQGHYKGELWGLGTSPNSPSFVTGGDDKSVRCWDIERREQVKRVNFENKIRALDWSNDGKKIVVADAKAIIYYYDSSLNFYQDYKGKPYENNAPKKNSKDVQIEGWVEQIKFSPNSQFIVYGTHGKSRTMEYLKVEDRKIAKHKQFMGGTSAVLHIDWSRESDMISFNTQAHELLFANINGQSVSASSVKDQPWASWTQKFGFPVQGIYQNADYSDINTVCRDPSSSFIAVGYDDQLIRLFKYPCYIPKQACKEYSGHSSHVTRIRFCREYMVSLGGEDKTIIVWKCDKQYEAMKASEEEGQQSDGLDDFDDDVDIPMKIIQKRKQKPKNLEFFEAEDEGDEFMAVKPWLGAIKEPTYKYPKQTEEPPNVKLHLEYVHGYRTKDCRQNLYYYDQKTIIYHAAAVLIYHNISDNTQTLFTDHADDILSIDFNRKEGSVLTGELGPNPLVNYYVNQKLTHSFKAPVKKGVLACAISPDSELAVCAGMDDDHVVTVLDLKKGKVLSSKKGGKKVILKLGWVNDSEFVSVGIKHFKYWTVDGANLSVKDGKTQEILVSLAIDKSKGTVLVGGSGGKIYSCKGGDVKLIKTLEYAFKAGPKEKEQYKNASVVESLTIQDEFIGAGTKDGYIFILNKSMEVISFLDLKTKLKDFNLHTYHPSVRSLDFSGNKLLVGTFGSEIFEIDIPNITKAFDAPEKSDGVKKHPATKPNKIVNIMKCHYSPNNTWTNEVWGLAISGDLIFTCSDDATVRCWSLSQRKLLSHASLNIMDSKDSKDFFEVDKDKKTNDYVEGSKGRSVLITPDRKYVIVGAKDGRVRIFNFNEKTYEMKCKLTFKHAKEWISDIKFGYNMLLIGSHDNGIYVYDYEEETGDFKRKYRPLQKHSSYITHLDVSRDSCFLQSTCGAYQLLFWDLNTGKQITSGASMLRDERWASWTCNLGWPVQGIYPKCTDGTFIHSVERSNTNIRGETYKNDETTPYLLAAGNNNGRVCVYNFPCTIKNSKFVEGVGHSSHITNVRWNQTDDYIVSVGGEDQCLMYWRVTK